MKAKLLGAIASLALLAGASSARAAIVEVTYYGVVTGDSDLTGIFGPAGGNDNLVGSAFQITYRFDTAEGHTYSSPTQNFAIGGSIYSVPSPSLGATVKVGAITGPAIAGSYDGLIYGSNDPSAPIGNQAHYAEDFNSTADGFNDAYANSSVYNDSGVSTIPASINTPFAYTPQPGDVLTLSAGYSSFDNAAAGYSIDTYIKGDITSITETVAPGPIPGAGLVGLAGLVLAGGLARARAARG